MKIKAAILVKLNSPMVIDDLEAPFLKPGQVMVKILYSGLCRAQLNEMTGLKGPDPHLPHLLGHEASGIVENTGRAISKVKAGDYVILSWIKGFGRDVPSTKYNWRGKTVNAGAVTTFSDYSIVSENRVTKISRKIPPDCAAIIGCAVATGAGVVRNTLKVKRGSSIAIFGVGGIGLSALMAAKAVGASKIIAVDIHPQKLKLARGFGATDVIDATQKRLLNRIHAIVPSGPDYAIDASGVKSTMELAFASLHPQGMLVIAGNLARGEKISLHPFELIKGKRILGTWGGETDPDRDFPRYGREYLKGVLPIERLISRRFSLDDINEAMDVFKNGEAGRILIRCS